MGERGQGQKAVESYPCLMAWGGGERDEGGACDPDMAQPGQVYKPQRRVQAIRSTPSRSAASCSVQPYAFLREISTVKNQPVGAQIKGVIDLLLETRQALTPQDIEERCFVDVTNNKEVLDSLKNNVKVSFDGQRFSYKSKHHVKSKQDLLVLIRKAPEGIPTGELKDSYAGILRDLQDLKASGQVWLILNRDYQQDIVYPNDPKVQIKVDDDVKHLVRGIENPTEFVHIQRELQKAGMKPASSTVRRKAAAGVQGLQPRKPKQKRQGQISKRAKLTNAHMPELFQSVPVSKT